MSVGILVLVLIAVSLVWYFASGSAKPNPALDGFAQCLASKNVTMYGLYSCPHCQDQKKAFGGSFQYVPYVECTQNAAKCTAMNIEKVPTWIFADGSRVEGVMSFGELSDKSGCSFYEQK